MVLSDIYRTFYETLYEKDLKKRFPLGPQSQYEFVPPQINGGFGDCGYNCVYSFYADVAMGVEEVKRPAHKNAEEVMNYVFPHLKIA